MQLIWFKRRPQNRRLGRDKAVLEVRLRSDQVRANRLRFAAIALFTLAGTLVGFFLLWRAGQWGLDLLVYNNPEFSIQQVQVQTDGIIPVDQLRRWSGVKIGQNLLSLDLTRVKRDLEMVTSIRSAAVERVMPHTIRLSITEREPIAQIAVMRLKTDGTSEPSYVYLDRDGQVMLPAHWRPQPNSPDATNNFPSICGLNVSEVTPGRKLDSASARAALQLLLAFQHSPMAGLADLRQIDISSPDILEVTTYSQNRIVFSLSNFEAQLRRWHDISQHARELGKNLLSLDLSVPDNIPAVMTNAVAAGPTPANPASPQPNRRRNV